MENETKHEHTCSLICYIRKQSRALTYQDMETLLKMVEEYKNHLSQLKYTTVSKQIICVRASEMHQLVELRLNELTQSVLKREERMEFKKEGVKLISYEDRTP